MIRAHALAERLPRPLALLLSALLIAALPLLGGVAPAHADDAAAPAATPVVTDPAAAAPAADPAAAAPAAAPALGERVLRFGDTGADVVALQALLGVAQTGTFDAATRKAVKKVQRAAGIKAHGVVGPKTLEAITDPAAAKRAKKASSRSLPRAGAPAASRAYARAFIASKYGWGSGQMSCLSTLWSRESGWRYRASNPNGRYHGIPQTSAGVWGAAGYTTSEYMSNPEVQIKVGAKYIKSRYGTPCSAWSFWRSHHWY